MPNISELSVGTQMDKSVSVSSDWNQYSGSPEEVVHLFRAVGIFWPKCIVPILTVQFFALIREFGRGIKSCKSHSYWLAPFNRKMTLHFPGVFPLISPRSVWHDEKHPLSLLSIPEILTGRFSRAVLKLSIKGYKYSFYWVGTIITSHTIRSSYRGIYIFCLYPCPEVFLNFATGSRGIIVHLILLFKFVFVFL